MIDQESNKDTDDEPNFIDRFFQRIEQRRFEEHKLLLEEFWKTLEGDTDE